MIFGGDYRASNPILGEEKGKQREKKVNLIEISQEGVPKDIGVLADVLSRDDNFRYPRRMLGEATFPRVDSTLVMFSLSDSLSNLTDPISITKLPPQSVLEKIEKELSKSQPAKPLKAVVQIAMWQF